MLKHAGLFLFLKSSKFCLLYLPASTLGSGGKEVEYESSLNQDLLLCLLHCHLSYNPWIEAIEAIHIKKLLGIVLAWQLGQCWNRVQERVNCSG